MLQGSDPRQQPWQHEATTVQLYLPLLRMTGRPMTFPPRQGRHPPHIKHVRLRRRNSTVQGRLAVDSLTRLTNISLPHLQTETRLLDGQLTPAWGVGVPSGSVLTP